MKYQVPNLYTFFCQTLKAESTQDIFIFNLTSSSQCLFFHLAIGGEGGSFMK